MWTFFTISLMLFVEQTVMLLIFSMSNQLNCVNVVHRTCSADSWIIKRKKLASFCTGLITAVFLLTSRAHYAHAASQIAEGLLMHLLGKHWLAVGKLWSHFVPLSPSPSQDRWHESILIPGENIWKDAIWKLKTTKRDMRIVHLFDTLISHQFLKLTWVRKR